MTKYFFSHSIAPVSNEVALLRFPLETVVAEFEKWSAGFASRYVREYRYRENHKVACVAHVKKVSASRNQLPKLIKPQNHILQFVFVPTEAGWTAVFGPCSFPKGANVPAIDEFAYDLARKNEIESRIPYFVSIDHEPRVDATDVAFFHRASYGKLKFIMCALPSDPTQNQFGCYIERHLTSDKRLALDGTLHRSMSFIAGRTEPFKDYGFDFDSLPEVTEFPEESFTDEHAEIMWSQFGEKQVEDILAPLGISPYDDAFYGTEGYLVRLTPAQVADPYTRQLVDAKDFEPTERIPLEKFQFFQGLESGPLRAWSSIPVTE